MQHLHLRDYFNGRLGAVPQGLVSLRVDSRAISGLNRILRCMPGSLRRVTIHDDDLSVGDGDTADDFEDSSEEEDQEADAPEQEAQAAMAPPLLEPVDGEWPEPLVQTASAAWPPGVTELTVWNFNSRPFLQGLRSLSIRLTAASIFYLEAYREEAMQPPVPVWFPDLALPSSLAALHVYIGDNILYDARYRLPVLPHTLRELHLELPRLAPGFHSLWGQLSSRQRLGRTFCLSRCPVSCACCIWRRTSGLLLVCVCCRSTCTQSPFSVATCTSCGSVLAASRAATLARMHSSAQGLQRSSCQHSLSEQISVRNLSWWCAGQLHAVLTQSEYTP
ncbi:hypothetical protein JKP88DRAFT_247095 [Tribonema minus]|uniref:Uncharacterized protein n=1 Tax=Tribonema minus TaxID=303371 RepID=A0A836CBV9_9STRA|nr:hypothetical protein JKP88DRAFT_247095 [Tribonema minus]